MKVILTQELKGRGGEGDVVEVAHGFAVNYLLPRGLAMPATPGNLKQLEQRMHNIKSREEKRVAEASGFASQLDGKVVTISVKVGEGGRMFGSVTAAAVAEAIAEQLGIEVDRRKVETHGHIKDIGDHAVEVAAYREVKASLTVKVVAEGAPVEDAPAAEPAAEAAEADVDAEAVTEAADIVVEDQAEAADETE